MVQYVVKRSGESPLARVTRGEATAADLFKGQGGLFRLVSGEGVSWELDPRVGGEIRPFSMRATASNGGARALTILNHLFFHGRLAYLLTGVPEDIHPADHTLGRRYVSRLDNFPFSSLAEVDRETWGRLRNHRGTSVGTLEGTGGDGLKLELPAELEDVGLPLAAASYLIYSAG